MCSGWQVLDLVDQPADDDEIVEPRRVAEPLLAAAPTTPQLDAIGSIVGDSTRPRAEDRPRLRSPSSAASRSTSTKLAKAHSVKRRARMKPTLQPRHRLLRLRTSAYSGHVSDCRAVASLSAIDAYILCKINGRVDTWSTSMGGPDDPLLLRRRCVKGALTGQKNWTAAMARRRAQGGLRRRHRRRRRPRPRRGLLPGQGARHHQRRGDRQGLARRRQHRPQHHDHPLELPLRRERAALRACARSSGRG